MKLPLGIDDYKKLIQQSFDHVDKSLFIKVFLDENTESTLITRPRRFGKTLNMSMLYYFLSNHKVEENKTLFAGKKIETAKTNKHKSCIDFQGQYPVIFITFKNIRANSFDEAKQQIAFKMSLLYAEHAYLSTSTELMVHDKAIFNDILNRSADGVNLQYSLEILSRYLCKHHNKKAIILLDEYDTPFHAAYTSATLYHEDLSDFMKLFIGAAFKGNWALEKGMLTGILRVSLMDLFSGANSIVVRSMMTPNYQEHFGFTQQETELLIRTQTVDLAASEVSIRLDMVTQWYNGYIVGDTLLYNPWSLISYLDQACTPNIYWNTSGEDSALGRSLLNSTFNMKSRLVSLLKGEDLHVAIDEQVVFTDLVRSEDSLWGLMLYSGYLKVVGDNKDYMNRLYQVQIPNFEVTLAYKRIVDSWFQATNPNELFNCLWENDITQFEAILKNYLQQTVSYHDLGPKTVEKIYHVMFLGMFFALQNKYIIDSNKEYGFGRYDLILIPKDKSRQGYIFEFKATDNASKLTDGVQEALTQIEETRYSARLEQEDIAQVRHVGIAFCGKQMKMSSELHNYQPQLAPPPIIATTSRATLFASPTVSSSSSSGLGSSNDEGHKDKKPRL